MLSRDNPELNERFAVVGSGEAECKSCQYVYSPKQGDPAYPVSKGTLFEARGYGAAGCRRAAHALHTEPP